jgi:hypothetical protein
MRSTRRSSSAAEITPTPRLALRCLVGCCACQTFWTAVLISPLTVDVTALAAWFLSAAVYSGAAVLLAALHSSSSSVRPTDPPADRTGCKACGEQPAPRRR